MLVLGYKIPMRMRIRCVQLGWNEKIWLALIRTHTMTTCVYTTMQHFGMKEGIKSLALERFARIIGPFIAMWFTMNRLLRRRIICTFASIGSLWTILSRRHNG